MVEKGRDIRQGPAGTVYEDLFSERPPTQVSGPVIGPADRPAVDPTQIPDRHLSYGGIRQWARLQWILTCGIVFICGLLVYLVVHSKPSANTGVAQLQPGPSQPPVEPTPQPKSVAQPQIGAASSTGPISRMTAEEYYYNGQFELAGQVYKSLLDQYATSVENEAARDFFTFRLALCERALGRTEQAIAILRRVANSRYPVIRAMARYHLGLGADRDRRYLDAAGEFYQSLALADTVHPMGPWIQEFRRCCSYMIARAITMEALSLREDPSSLPAALGVLPAMVDPWGRLDDDQWQTAIRSCASQFNDAVLGPIIEPVQSTTGQQWRVISNGAGLEEVLKRLSARTGLDINWTWQGTTGTVVVEQSARRRPVHVFIDSASQQEAIAMMAGSVGLFLQKTGNGSMAVVDPYNYRSLGEHIAWLRQQAISLWHQFRLDWDQSDLLARSYLAVGLLYEHDGQPTEAIAQYALLSSRSSDLQLVPHALWRSGRLRGELGDYAGAREDLARLIEQYPDAPMTSSALMILADVTIRTGLYDEAARIAIKSYHSSTLASDQAQAALTAGRCLYLAGQYQQAIRWFGRYMELSGNAGYQSQKALFWLGKSYLAIGQLPAAATSLERALDGASDVSTYTETATALVGVYLGLNDHLKAMGLLEGRHPVQLRQRERTQMAILKAKVLSSMGLNDKAAALLEEHYKLVSDPNQKINICMDLGQCYKATGQWERARAILAEALMTARPGPMMSQVSLDLAYVSYKLDRFDQTIALCQQVLRSDVSSDLKARALDLLYATYMRQGQYDRAAKTLVLSEKR